jgi:choline dehydrogenase
MSYGHPVGTCALGTGPSAVVDPSLRVRGIHNLRVADASVLPRIPAVAPSVTVQMIGWRAAELLLSTSDSASDPATA